MSLEKYIIGKSKYAEEYNKFCKKADEWNKTRQSELDAIYKLMEEFKKFPKTKLKNKQNGKIQQKSNIQ